MKEYVICMDASGDLDRSFANAHGIRFVPMSYTLGEELRTSQGCEDDDLLKRFYDGQRSGDLTQTSQVTPYMYEEFFTPILETGVSILYLALSGGLSDTHKSSLVAIQTLREQFPQQEILSVDTLSATGGIGLLLELAVRNQDAGMNLQDNYQSILQLVKKIRHFFMVQDLMYLKRGGRVSATTAYVGSMLKLKPQLQIDENGKLITSAKKRGNTAAMNALYDFFAENHDPSSGNLLYICDGDCPELAQQLVDKISAAFPDVLIRRTMLTPIIGAHTGPGMLSVIFIGK